MALPKPCSRCGRLVRQSPCDACRRIIAIQKRPQCDGKQRARRKQAVTNHVRDYGNVCPGWQRPPHPSTDLTADHITPVGAGGSEDGPLQVLCRSCNSRKSARS